VIFDPKLFSKSNEPGVCKFMKLVSITIKFIIGRLDYPTQESFGSSIIIIENTGLLPTN